QPAPRRTPGLPVSGPPGARAGAGDRLTVSRGWGADSASRPGAVPAGGGHAGGAERGAGLRSRAERRLGRRGRRGRPRANGIQDRREAAGRRPPRRVESAGRGGRTARRVHPGGEPQGRRPMASLTERMVGAAKLDPATYEEVEADTTATTQAMLV